MTNPNERLRRAREAIASPGCPDAVMSRQELAEAVNESLFRATGKTHDLDSNYIGKLERGTIRWPSKEYRQAFRTVLGVTIDADLGFYNTHRAAAEKALVPVSFPTVLAPSTGESSPPALVDLLARTQPPELPSRVGDAEVEQIAASADLFTKWDHSYGGCMVREAVRTQLKWSSQLLNVSASESARMRLSEAVGRLGLVCGFMAFDADARDDAERIFKFALACAETSGNWHLRAKVYSSMAREAIWYGDADTGLTLIEFALVRSDRLTGTEQAMLHTARARALAKMCRIQDALRAVGAADEAFARADAGENPPWMAYYDEAQHAGDTGHALFDLSVGGHPTQAGLRLATATEGHKPEYVRSRFLSQIKLASLTMATGDPHEATEQASRAFDLAPCLRSGRARRELIELKQRAEPQLAIPRVRELCHTIDTMTTEQR